MSGYANGGYPLGMPDYQFVDDETVLGQRFSTLERATFGSPPKRPAVGDWALDMDANGVLVAVNLRTSMSYPITLGAGTAIPPS